MFILSALLALSAQEAKPFRIEADLVGGRCTYKLDGVAMERRALETAVLESGRPAPIKARLNAPDSLPYRCVAPLAPRLRLLELRGIPFARLPALPPTKIVRLAIPAWGCAPTIDGQPVAIEDMAVLARDWDRDGIHADFAPDGEVPVRCVDAVLTQLIAARYQGLGFSGTGFGE